MKIQAVAQSTIPGIETVYNLHRSLLKSRLPEGAIKKIYSPGFTEFLLSNFTIVVKEPELLIEAYPLADLSYHDVLIGQGHGTGNYCWPLSQVELARIILYLTRSMDSKLIRKIAGAGDRTILGHMYIGELVRVVWVKWTFDEDANPILAHFQHGDMTDQYGKHRKRKDSEIYLFHSCVERKNASLESVLSRYVSLENS